MELWTEARQSNNVATPTWEDHQYLNLPSNESHRSGAQKSWPAAGGELIKIRVKHRSPDGLKPPPNKHYPYLVQVAGYDDKDRILLQHVSFVAFIDPGKDWKITEAVAPLAKETKRFTVSLIAMSGGGNYQISHLDIVEVRTTTLFKICSTILIIAWSGWILWAIRKQRKQRPWTNPSSIFATAWIIGWGVLLVFPRTVDIPRPFFSHFNSPAKTIDTPVSEYRVPASPQAPDKEATSRIAPEPISWTNKTLTLFKNHWGGRFLLHLSVMGLFAGVLLLLMQPRQALPFIIAMVVGVELIPWIWLGNIDNDDASDIVAYGIAIALALPISARFRR